jgi:hypothetical protein
MMLSHTLHEAHNGLWMTLDGVVEQYLSASISPRVLFDGLLFWWSDIFMPVRYKQVMRTSLQVTIEFERRVLELKEEFSNRH